MALTQNEQLILKYVGQNFLTKESMSNIIPCRTMNGKEEFSNKWLTKDGITSLVPIQGAFYFVTDVGNIFQWSVLENRYLYANAPEQLTKEEVSQLW